MYCEFLLTLSFTAKAIQKKMLFKYQPSRQKMAIFNLLIQRFILLQFEF